MREMCAKQKTTKVKQIKAYCAVGGYSGGCFDEDRNQASGLLDGVETSGRALTSCN